VFGGGETNETRIKLSINGNAKKNSSKGEKNVIGGNEFRD
jgi:hypothetical protein